MKPSIESRIARLESDSPSNDELKDFILRDDPRPADAALLKRIDRHTPDFIKRMGRDELLHYIEN